MTRTWPVPGAADEYGYVRYRPTFLQRIQAGIHPRLRRRLQVERDQSLVELRQVDGQLERLSARRVELLDELEAVRDQLWPEAPNARGRRPPALDQAPLPPVVADVRWVNSRELRGLCLAMLGRQGMLALPDMHAMLHRFGYGIASAHPVKALADAMAYEVRCGRAVRVRRGVYDLAAEGRSSGFRRSPDPRRYVTDHSDPVSWCHTPVDADLREDPDRWIPLAWPDPPDTDPPPSEPGPDGDPNPKPDLHPPTPVPPTDVPASPSETLGAESAQIRPRGSGEHLQAGGRRPSRTVETADDGRWAASARPRAPD